MRFRKSIKNLLVSWIGQIAYIIVNLFARRIFIDVLGVEMLGISGLFSNILSFLSFAELGISSAICFSLYKPLAEQNYICIRRIMHFFKITYRVIGIFILSAGTLMIPVLSGIVPEIKQYPNFYLYYELFVINTAISYFYVYKATLIEANQDRYIKIANHYIWVCLLGIIQVIGLICFQNYIIYLVIQTVFTLAENICVSIIADKHFPYLREREQQFPEQETLKQIMQNVIGTSLNKLGTVLVTATDNILISRFSGLAVTGIFSNYTYIVTGVGQIFLQIYSSIQAGIGDLNARKGSAQVRKIYQEVLFDGYIVYSFGFVILVNCISDFICLWIGENEVIQFSILFIHLCNFYIAGMRTANITFINAMGLYWRGKYRGIMEGILNFSISIFLGSRMGIMGVLLGTFISALFIGGVVEPTILCRYGFVTNVGFIISPFIKYSICTFASVYLICAVNYKIFGNSITIWNMIFKIIISICIYIGIVYALWRKKAEFKSLQDRVQYVAHKINERDG